MKEIAFRFDRMIDEVTKQPYDQVAIDVDDEGETREGSMIQIVIPAVPDSQNQMYMNKLHYHQRSQEKKKWENYIRMFSASVRPEKPIPKSIVTIRYWFPTKSRRDPDNYSGKFLLDGLVKAGIIVDDSFEHIKLLIEKGGVDKHNPRTEIVIQEVRG